MCAKLENKMNFKLLCASVIILVVSSTCWSYSTGSPDESDPYDNSCIKMNPSISHPHKGGMQTSPSPFQLIVDKRVVRNGETVTLIINKKQDISTDINTFKGFIVQGFDQQSEEVLGDFEVTDGDSNALAMTCFGRKGSSVSHKHNKPKSSITLKWKAPTLTNTTCVKFYATVLAKKKMFWVKMAINLIQVEKASLVPSSTTSNFTCTDVDCNNNCIVSSTASSNYLSQINSPLLFLVWMSMCRLL